MLLSQFIHDKYIALFTSQLTSLPNLLALHCLDSARYPFLLEDSSPLPSSHYSFLFCFPEEVITTKWGDTELFTEVFDKAFQQQRQTALLKTEEKTSLPFTGGWFVYLGYELASQIEPTLTLDTDVFNLPIAIATRIKSAIIIDHQKEESWWVSEEDDSATFKQVMNDIKQCQQNNKARERPKIKLEEDPPQQYLDAVSKISEYIKAGDVFQVNLSRAWQGELDSEVHSADVYTALRHSNPAPFSALVKFADFSIISSSPERLVSVKEGQIETRPIAGTRPRSKDKQQDTLLLDELINHPKERAEHIMLIDLERNDMGRICQSGTVEVDELMTVESYEHVHHIVSNIKGQLTAGITPAEVIKAVFPGGTITGCPKIRCMEIIAELESVGRGAYTGSLGYINHSGDMDLNILIRTIVMKNQQINFRTGAGIVYDSIPKREVEETRHKAKGLIRAFS
ncbi:MAG: aminodeoxychorismate synthase component I [Thiotrichaceae bacterium]|nr:aminodeoxychorismate synthase component I [Thiotrichaceae bacterium]